MSVVQRCARVEGRSLWGLLLCVLVLCLVGPSQADVYVDSRSASDQRPEAVASDRVLISAEEVAREVLRLQRQMGGSIVDGRSALRGWHDPQSPVTGQEAPRWPVSESQLALQERNRTATQRQASRVAELRETAWQLDTRAHHLEELDLYEQADLLRDVAKQMRHSAREMKQQLSKATVKGQSR